MTGPGGATVKGSPFAAERGLQRFYSGRGRGFRPRGGFRPRVAMQGGNGVPGMAYGQPGDAQMMGSRGGFRGRGRGFIRRRFYRQEVTGGRPVGQQQLGDGQVEGGNGFQQDSAAYEQRQSRGRPRRYIQRFFRRRPRRPRGDEEGGEAVEVTGDRY